MSSKGLDTGVRRESAAVRYILIPGVEDLQFPPKSMLILLTSLKILSLRLRSVGLGECLTAKLPPGSLPCAKFKPQHCRYKINPELKPNA